ncbi:MAG TPA: hypothetical protein VFZ76_05670, partial [Anaerolineales bacterium]
MQLDYEEIRRYLDSRSGAPVEIQEVRQLGKDDVRGAEAIKQFGFGRPLMVTYQSGEQISQIVIHR